jgi:hypothetical protein
LVDARSQTATKIYEFTLIFDGVDAMTEKIANDLYEAGCSDGSPFSGEGIAAIGFDHAAPSLEDAIKSAVGSANLAE